MSTIIRTVEAVYEHGYLRPLLPPEAREGLVYWVTVVDVAKVGRKKHTQQSLRGKFRGYLSTTEELSQNKQAEKALEF
jgi:predicted DNA-binding antitoxin AbrB/MazE fold protein